MRPADIAPGQPGYYDVLSEDALLIWARGFSPPVLAPGESADRPLLGSLRHARLLHEPLVVTPAHFARAAAPVHLTVPAADPHCN